MSLHLQTHPPRGPKAPASYSTDPGNSLDRLCRAACRRPASHRQDPSDGNHSLARFCAAVMRPPLRFIRTLPGLHPKSCPVEQLRQRVSAPCTSPRISPPCCGAVRTSGRTPEYRHGRTHGRSTCRSNAARQGTGAQRLDGEIRTSICCIGGRLARASLQQKSGMNLASFSPFRYDIYQEIPFWSRD